MIEALLQKLDARGLYQLERGRRRGRFEVLLRTVTPPTPEERIALRDAGAITRSIAGNVMSATIASAARLEEVARLPFVSQIEVSRAMFDE